MIFALRASMIVAALASGGSALAAQVKILKVQPKAFFVESQTGLFEGLDMKQKQIRFEPDDFSRCGQSLQRKLESLTYTCRVSLPQDSEVTRLKSLMSPAQLKVRFGRTDKFVSVRLAPDARYATFTVEFDDTGVDYEVQKFNEEFFSVYAKVAHTVITEAMDQNPLLVQVVERPTSGTLSLKTQ